MKLFNKKTNYERYKDCIIENRKRLMEACIDDEALEILNTTKDDIYNKTVSVPENLTMEQMCRFINLFMSNIFSMGTAMKNFLATINEFVLDANVSNPLPDTNFKSTEFLKYKSFNIEALIKAFKDARDSRNIPDGIPVELKNHNYEESMKFLKFMVSKYDGFFDYTIENVDIGIETLTMTRLVGSVKTRMIRFYHKELSNK